MGSRKRPNEEQEREEEARTAEAAVEGPGDAVEDADSVGGGEEEPSASGAEELDPKEMIETLAAELKELEDRHLRLAAEYDNFRKRTTRERAQYADRAQAELARQLLESLDDLSRVSHMSSAEHNAAAILEGVKLVEQKLLRALRQAGLEPIDAVGEPFNPEIHEALVTVGTDDPEEDEIVSQEVAKGYLFKGVLLRPSLVEVKQYDSGTAQQHGDPDPEDGS